MYMCGRCGATFTDGYKYRSHIASCKGHRITKISKKLR